MMNVVHPSFTENVSKYDTQITFTRINIYFLLSPKKIKNLHFFMPNLELVSKELNHLAAILHVYAGGLNFMK